MYLAAKEIKVKSKRTKIKVKPKRKEILKGLRFRYKKKASSKKNWSKEFKLEKALCVKNSRAGSGLRFHQGTRQYYR
ncbi:MAG: hypothetical protein AB7U51_13015, partial [Arcobacter sp.]|uniref:hypothetical protein n=1 Tax=Arcobacter sp. TaxID=1872629 RepID=UPI003CFEC717